MVAFVPRVSIEWRPVHDRRTRNAGCGKAPPTHARHAGDPGQLPAESLKMCNSSRDAPQPECLLVGTRLTRLGRRRETVAIEKPTRNSRDITKIRYEMHTNHMDQSEYQLSLLRALVKRLAIDGVNGVVSISIVGATTKPQYSIR